MSEGFGMLGSLTDLDLGFCGKLDQVATLQLIIEKFQGLTKLSLAGWEITDLTEGNSITDDFIILSFDVRRLRYADQPAEPQLAIVRQSQLPPRK